MTIAFSRPAFRYPSGPLQAGGGCKALDRGRTFLFGQSYAEQAGVATMPRTEFALVCLLSVWACEESTTGPEPGTSRPEFVSVATGNSTACALTTDGDVYCWGSH